MKKRALALALTGAITLFNVGHTNDINEFERDYLKIHETNSQLLKSIFPSTYEFVGLVGKRGEADYDFVQNTRLPFSNDFELYLNIGEVGKITLDRYYRDSGVAHLEAIVKPTLLFKHDKEEYQVSFLNPGSAKITLDKNRREFSSEILYEGQSPDITVESLDENDNLEFIKGLSWSFGQLSNKKSHSYSERFSDIKTFKNQFIIDDYQLMLSDEMTDSEHKPFNELNVEKIEFNSDYDLTAGNYIHGLTFYQSGVDSNKFNVDLSKFDYLYTFLTDEKNQLSDLTEKLIIDDIRYQPNDNLDMSVSFGGGALEYGIEHLNVKDPQYILKLSQSIISALVAEASGDRTSYKRYETEMIDIYNTLLAKGTTFKYHIDLHAPNDANRASLHFDATLSQEIDDLKGFLEENRSLEQFLEYIEQLNFTLNVSDNYLVDQYVSYLQLTEKAENLDEARKSANDQIKAVILMSSALAPEGVKLFDRDDNGTMINIKYEDSRWTINGDEYSNDEFLEILNGV